jgi:hypothetical protein
LIHNETALTIFERNVNDIGRLHYYRTEMRHLLLLCFFLLYSQLSKSQSFIEDYYETKRASWEITEEMRSQVNPELDSMHRADWGVGWLEHKMETKKWNTAGKVEMMKKIISLTPQLKTDESLYFVEEILLTPLRFMRHGFIKSTDSTAFYGYDMVNRDTIYIYEDFPSTSISLQQKSREIILNLVKKNDLSRLLELAKLEELINKAEQSQTLQYEIIYYNPELDQKIQTILLHDWIVNLK